MSVHFDEIEGLEPRAKTRPSSLPYKLVLLFTSLLAIPLARQRFFHALALAGFQVEGMTFDFFDDVFLLYLAFEPAQCIFKRLAFLNANLCQCVLHLQTSREGSLQAYGNQSAWRQAKSRNFEQKNTFFNNFPQDQSRLWKLSRNLPQ